MAALRLGQEGAKILKSYRQADTDSKDQGGAKADGAARKILSQSRYVVEQQPVFQPFYDSEAGRYARIPSSRNWASATGPGAPVSGQLAV